jgi:Cephalosporin hydroxylase
MSTSNQMFGQSDDEELRTYYPDDPDPQLAGRGLAYAPMVFRILEADHLDYWMMNPSEQIGLLYLLEHLRPKVAIEIGTKFGGSLQVLAQFCERVYSLDIDPDVPLRLKGKYSNVEYIIGPSDHTLPPLIHRLQSEQAELSFVLVDGDHSLEGVRKDIDNVLQFKPVVPVYIIMHDSFNAECRDGLTAANWAACPYVHAVELDFVAGNVSPTPSLRGQLWGGLALGILRPEPRRGRFEITARSDLTFQIAHKAEQSRYRQPLHRRILRRIRHVYRWFFPGP